MQPDAAIVVVALVVAVATAARSTWSPCGLSMLSMITPLGEASRGNRYGRTVAWFVLGGVLGGATLGAAAAVATAGVRAASPDPAVLAALGAVLAAVAVASDLRLAGFRLPAHRRQVDEVWLSGFRPWVYGLGFGWQIGVGVATYVVTAGIHLTVALAVLTASPATAFAVGVVLGSVRGLAVLLGVGLASPEDLRRFHLRLEALGPASARAMTAVLVLAAVALASVVAPAVGAAVLAVVVGAAAVLRARRRDAGARARGAGVPTRPATSG